MTDKPVDLSYPVGSRSSRAGLKMPRTPRPHLWPVASTRVLPALSLRNVWASRRSSRYLPTPTTCGAPLGYLSLLAAACAEHRGRSPRSSKSKRNHPRPRLMDTSRVDGVKAQQLRGTPGSCVLLLVGLHLLPLGGGQAVGDVPVFFYLSLANEREPERRRRGGGALVAGSNSALRSG